MCCCITMCLNFYRFYSLISKEIDFRKKTCFIGIYIFTRVEKNNPIYFNNVVYFNCRWLDTGEEDRKIERVIYVKGRWPEFSPLLTYVFLRFIACYLCVAVCNIQKLVSILHVSVSRLIYKFIVAVKKWIILIIP